MYINIDSFLSAWPILVAVTPVIVAQVIAYIKLGMQVDGLLRSINGVGQKIREVEKKIVENEIEQLLRQSEISNRISHVEGMMESIYKTKHTNGLA